MAHSASSPRGYCSRIISTPITADTDSARTSMLVHSRKSPAPNACAVSPLVPIRTNEQFQ